MPVGRNDPCPCGSGLKYKKCHLLRDEEKRPLPEPGRSSLHDLDNLFVDRVFMWAVERFEPELKKAALELGKGGALAEFLVPWLIYHHPLRDRLPAFELYAREHEVDLLRRERDWIEAQRSSWLSVWEVHESVAGKSMLLTDLLTGEKRLVQEASASRLVVARDALLARVVDFGDDSILVGTHDRFLHPSEAAGVVDKMRATLGADLPLAVDRLRDAATGRLLIEIWQEAVAADDERRTQPPELRNTDGDPMQFVMDRYRVSEEDRVLGALTSLRGAGEIEEKEDGTRAIGFSKRGNRMHGHWESTIVGSASLTKNGELRLETNSLRRAAALRKRVEKVCAGLLTEHRRTVTGPREVFEAYINSDDFDADNFAAKEPMPPEDEAILREEKARHYATWPDTPLPALGGKTPREAVRTRRGREEVVLLLKDFENAEARVPAGARFDVGTLRRELGIEE